MAQLFWTANSVTPTTAAHVPTATVSGCHTYLQVATPSTLGINVVAFGVEFNAALTVATTVELVDTGTVAATGLTAAVAAGVQPYGTNADAVSASGVTLGTGATGYSAGAGTEGSTTVTRTAKEKILPIGASEYEWEWSFGREFRVPPSHFLRVRITTTTTAPTVFTWVLWDEG